MKRKLLVAIVLIVVLSLTSVWALNDLSVQALVGKCLIYINGEQVEFKGEGYNILQDGKTPVTLVYNNQVYIPVALVNEFDMEYIPDEATIMMKDKKKDSISNAPIPAPSQTPIQDLTDPSDIVERNNNAEVNKFTKDDLAINNGSKVKFYVGTDKYDKFIAMYAVYHRSYLKQSDTMGKGLFYGKTTSLGYDFFMDVDVKWDTKIVQSLVYSEDMREEVKNPPKFITNRGIDRNSTIADVYKKYGNKCNEEVTHGPDMEIIFMDYYFETPDGKKGVISFYAEGPAKAKKENLKVTGIRIVTF